MAMDPLVYRAKDPQELRASWEQVWNANDRAWERARDTCRCQRPAPGATYLGVTRCVKCDHKMDGLQLRRRS